MIAYLKWVWRLPITSFSNYHSMLLTFCSWKALSKRRHLYDITHSRSGCFAPAQRVFRYPLQRSWVELVTRTPAAQLEHNLETRADMASFRQRREVTNRGTQCAPWQSLHLTNGTALLWARVTHEPRQHESHQPLHVFTTLRRAHEWSDPLATV